MLENAISATQAFPLNIAPLIPMVNMCPHVGNTDCLHKIDVY